MKNSTLILCGFAVLGGIGSIMLGLYPVFGAVLTILCVLSVIYSIISTNKRNTELSKNLDVSYSMMFRSGAGNAYKEYARKEIEKHGNTQEVVDYLMKALDLNPNDTDAIYMLSYIAIMQYSFMSWVKPNYDCSNEYSFQRLKRLIQHGIKLDPKNATFYIIFGVIRDIEKKHILARACFKKASKYAKDSFWRLALSTSYGFTKDYDKTLEQIKLARKEGADGWVIEFYHGRALSSLGHFEKAIFYLKKANSLYPNKPEILDFYQGAYYGVGSFFKSSHINYQLSYLFVLLNPLKSFSYFCQATLRLLIAIICKMSKLFWKISKKNTCLSKIHIKIFPLTGPH